MSIFKDWDTTVRLGDLHDARGEGAMTVQQVAGALAKRLEGNRYYKEEQARLEASGTCGSHPDDGLMSLVEELRELADDMGENDPDVLIEAYDDILSGLYDYGDFEKRVWIK